MLRKARLGKHIKLGVYSQKKIRMANGAIAVDFFYRVYNLLLFHSFLNLHALLVF